MTGTDPGGPPDFDGDGTVGILDLLTRSPSADIHESPSSLLQVVRPEDLSRIVPKQINRRLIFQVPTY